MSTDLFLLPAEASWESKRSDWPEIPVRTRLACGMRFSSGKKKMKDISGKGNFVFLLESLTENMLYVRTYRSTQI